MRSSEEGVRQVRLTKFKKMASNTELHKVDERSDLQETSECVSDEDELNASQAEKELNICVTPEVRDSPETCAKISSHPERVRKKNILCLPEDVSDLSCTSCNSKIGRFGLVQRIECQNSSARSRRKSWCVESSLKKQFCRNSEIRRTLERSEGLPPVFELQASSASSFVSSPARLVDIIDQRLRRLKLAGRAMTLAIPSEGRRTRPSILDSGRRRCSEVGLSLTLSGLKARRKIEALTIDGIKLNTRTCSEGKLSKMSNNSSKRPVTKNSPQLNSINHVQLPIFHSSGGFTELPITATNSSNSSSSSKDGNCDKCIRYSVPSVPHSPSFNESEDPLIQGILTFNGRNIFDAEEEVAPHQEISKQRKLSKREAGKGCSLLQPEDVLQCSDSLEEAEELAKSLRRHLSSFADRLHMTKDRLEDTAKCYLLLDKAYEWALEAMKALGRVKACGSGSPDQVGAAANTLGELLQENPPVPEETFNAMFDMAEKLNNQTLLQQCKMAHARCEETLSLLRSRQAALMKARHQMECNCRSFVDLSDVVPEPEETSSLTWLSGTPFNSSGRRRSGCSVGSRPRDPLSRCSSIDTDDDSVFSETPFSSTPSKCPLEAKSSLGGIKELRESDEDLLGKRSFVRGSHNFLRSSVNDFRMSYPTDPPSFADSSPTSLHTVTTSTVRAFSSGSSSCSSSDSSGPITGSTFAKDRLRGSWRFSDTSQRSTEDANDTLFESLLPTSPLNNRSLLPWAANSHLLIRGSQINLSNSEDLSNEEVRRNKTLLLIMQELIQTERDYVNSLEYIIENYVPELLIEDIPQALRGQRNVIFGNIEKIYEFHSAYFLRALESCQTKPFAVGSIFLRYENQFYLYALYNKNKPKSDDLMAELGSSFFRTKQMELADKMDLSSYLLKPVQRMGKYALLLKQLLKECGPNEEGYDDLKAAEEMVQFQLRHGNDLLAMDSLRDCDVNLKEQGRLLRQGEFLVTEGNRGRKSLRHVFLFEDLILFSKSRRDPERKTLEVFQYKQSLKTTDIGLTAQVGDSPLKFEIWFRKRKPSDTFVLQGCSPEMKEAWADEISKLLWRQALRNRKLRLHELSSMGIGNKPCLDIRPSEDQINDRSVCVTKAPQRLRLSSSAGFSDTSSGVRRPQSVISVSSSASSGGSSQSSSAGPPFVGTLNLGFESGDSPKPLQRSVTRTSQCSAESGIMADLYPEREGEEGHSKVERSNSTATNTSADSALSPSTPVSLSLSPSTLQFPHSPSSSPVSLSDGTSHPLSTLIRSADVKTNKTLLTTEV